MQVNTNVGKWVRSYGGKINHLISGHGKRDSVTGLSGIIFACGKKAVWSEWGQDYSKGKCVKCQAAEQNMHLTLGESAASDGESKPAPKQVI